MSHEEATEVESQQKTSINKESRENIPISTTAPKKSASHPSLQVQQSQNEQSSTAESSQEMKMNLGRKQKDKNKDILKSNNAYQSVSGKDIINNNKSTSNGNTSSTTSNVNSGVDENSNCSFDHDGNISGGDTDHDPLQENGISIPRRQSMNDTPQKLMKSHSMHQRHNSTPNSSSINFITTNTSISVSPPSPTSSSSSNDNNNNNDNTNQANTNSNVNTSNATYPNGIPPQMYEETPQMSYPNMNPNAPFMPVPSQYFPPIFLNNGQYFYDQYNRFGRPPPQIPPSAQQTYVRSNVYPYHQIPVIPPMHPSPYHSSSPLISHQTLPTRYLNPSSATGGDSGFSSRRSSLDQVRTPDLGPQHPPRIHQQKKPKQLDKALWVGNLPDATTQEELKEFFADENMESVFHIKKSNCAFVNYKTYDAVLEAVHKYNEIEFKGIKLVCRPRKFMFSSKSQQTHTELKLKTESLSAFVSENTPPATPSEAGSTASSSTRSRRSSLPPRRIRQPSVASMSPASSVSSLKPSSQNRYFILKSLTQDDLDISVKNGLWATQPHNEAALNKAFKSAENVYLIFSANKSGEFYGYARMLSPISKETTETVQWTPIDEAALAASSSRLSPNQDESKLRRKLQDEENEDCEDDAVPSRNWGTTFKVEWIKVQKLPFIRTRQLRNPWNANREVKISRDGTEVEPVVGERLLAEFNKSPPITASYSNISGPLLTQPLNIDGQVVGEGQDRMLSTQNGAQMPPMIDPNFMPNAQPAYFTPPPGYWHPQPIIIPPYGAPPVPPGYVQAQQTWTTSSPKDQSRIQPTQPSTGVAGSTAMAPMMTLDQQQYVEGHMPQQHPSHYPAPHLYQPGAGVHYHQAPPQQYYRSSEDNSHVDGPMTYQQQQQENMGNDQESVPSYLMEEQRQSVEASSNA